MSYPGIARSIADECATGKLLQMQRREYRTEEHKEKVEDGYNKLHKNRKRIHSKIRECIDGVHSIVSLAYSSIARNTD